MKLSCPTWLIKLLFSRRIDGVSEDMFISEAGILSVALPGGVWRPVANQGMLQNTSVEKDTILLRRDVRYSLTCRDVEKVNNIATFIRR